MMYDSWSEFLKDIFADAKEPTEEEMIEFGKIGHEFISSVINSYTSEEIIAILSMPHVPSALYAAYESTLATFTLREYPSLAEELKAKEFITQDDMNALPEMTNLYIKDVMELAFILGFNTGQETIRDLSFKDEVNMKKRIGLN